MGNLPAGNILLSAAVAFNGASYTQVHRVSSSTAAVAAQDVGSQMGVGLPLGVRRGPCFRIRIQKQPEIADLHQYY